MFLLEPPNLCFRRNVFLKKALTLKRINGFKRNKV